MLLPKPTRPPDPHRLKLTARRLTHTAIERIEERREPNPEMDAVYILTPDAHIVDCLLADFEVRRYRKAYVIWISLLDPDLRRRVDSFPGVNQLRPSSTTLPSDFFPRESHLVIFRDPWSFPVLYHPACNSLIPEHMRILAQKVRWSKDGHLCRVCDLTTDSKLDCWSVHHTWRIPQSPLLPTTQCDP